MHFGKMTSQRTDFGGKGGPGPGDYDPYKEVLNKAENANVHDEEVAAVRHESRVPRYHEAIAKEIEKRVSGGLLYYYRRLINHAVFILLHLYSTMYFSLVLFVR